MVPFRCGCPATAGGETFAHGASGITIPEPHRPWLALSIALAVCVLYGAVELSLLGGRLGMPLDDGWIHLQFARQVAAGEGLAYNPGRWVSGSTAPLWTALLALGFVPGMPLLWAKTLGVGFFLCTVYATDRLAAELGLDAGARRLAAVLVALTPWLAWSAMSGMEITAFAALSLWGIVVHLRLRGAPSKPPLSLPLFAAAALLRPEGLLLVLLATGDALVRCEETAAGVSIVATPRWRRWLPAALAALVVLLPTALFYYRVGGSFLPTTFAVKTSPAGDLLPSGRYLRTVIDVLFRSQPVMLLLAGAGILRLVERLGGPRDRGLLPAAWPVGLALAYALLSDGPPAVGNFGRYYFPILPLVVVLGVLGLDRAARRLGSVAVAGWRLPLRAILVAAILAPQLWGVRTGPGRYAQTLANVEQSDVAAARWLAGRLDADAVLAVQDIGAIKYHLPNRVIDLAGIVNPEILPFLRGSGPGDPVPWERRLLAYLEQQMPDYLVVFPSSYPWLTRQPGFTAIRAFPIARNVTMAGSELVIFSTPWTRFPVEE